MVKTASGLLVRPPANAEGPSHVQSSTKKTETVIPAGTVINVREVEAAPNKPAERIISVTPPLPITQTITEALEAVSVAQERKPDKSAELKKLDNEARAPLLYVGIGLIVVGAIVAFVLKMPVIGGKIAVLGGGGALVAWKVAEVPWWVCGFGVLLALVGWAFYTRGSWDANGNGTPDFLEKKD